MAVRCALVACAVLVLTGCGAADNDDAPQVAETSPHAAGVETFGYIRSVSTAGGRVTIAFDEAEWLSGKEAQQAAEEDGATPPGEPVPNDYYIRNRDTTTRTLEVVAEAKITARRCGACREGKPGNLADFIAAFGETGQSYMDDYRGAESQYWVTIASGRVVAIDEQYRP
jgi:hypothetical protein